MTDVCTACKKPLAKDDDLLVTALPQVPSSRLQAR